MILDGSRERTRTTSTGVFHCPREHGNRRFVLYAVRPWLAIGSIPVVPLRERCRFVECQTCRSTFEPVVLDRPHTHLEDVLTATLRRATATILAAEAHIGPDLRRAAVIVLQRHTATHYRPDDLNRDIAAERADPGRALAELDDLVVKLNDRGRSMLVSAVGQLASADLDLCDERIDALQDVAHVLGVPVERMRSMQRRPGGPALAV